MKKLQKGFTLVEIMIVVAIIGILLSVAIPALVKARRSAQEMMITNNMRVIRDTFEQLAFEQMKDPIYISSDEVFETIGAAPSGEPSYNCMHWPRGNIFFLDININRFPALSIYWAGNNKWYSTDNISGGTFQEMFAEDSPL